MNPEDVRETDVGMEDVPSIPPTGVVTLEALKAKVFLALPWQKHTNPMTAFCVAGLMDRRRVTTCLNFGDAFVTHSRNTCADLFLASPCEWMLMIDDDMLVPFGNAKWFNAYAEVQLPPQFAGLNALDRLLSHKKTLIGALYFGRHAHGAAMYSEGAGHPDEAAYCRQAPMDKIQPTRWVATGCMLVHRKVFEAIEKRFPRLARGQDGKKGQWFTSSENSIMDVAERCRDLLGDGSGMTGEKAHKVHTILELALREARNKSSLGMGEDVQFCIRASEAGHQPYVDMGLVCGHIGHKVYGPWNTKPRRK